MQNNYYIKNMVERISRGDFTYFLNEKECKDTIHLLNKYKLTYNLYIPYREAEKVMLYKEQAPRVKIYKIEHPFPLTHQSILGTLFSLQINIHVIGDILIGDETYIIFLSSMEEYLLNHFVEVDNYPIHLVQAKFSDIESFEKNYEDIYITVPSLRIDAIISKLLWKSRSQVEDLIDNKEILLNNKAVQKGHTGLHEKDTFSVRRYGKYEYIDKTLIHTKHKIHLKKYI